MDLVGSHGPHGHARQFSPVLPLRAEPIVHSDNFKLCHTHSPPGGANHYVQDSKLNIDFQDSKPCLQQ